MITLTSIKKTNRALIIDTSNEVCGLSPSLLSQILKTHKQLKNFPEILAMPFAPEPTSYGLTKYFYKSRFDVINKVLKMLKINKKIKSNIIGHHDVPGEWFKGPF